MKSRTRTASGCLPALLTLSLIIGCSDRTGSGTRSQAADPRPTSGVASSQTESIRRQPAYYFSKNVRLQEVPLEFSLHGGRKPVTWSVLAGRTYYSITQPEGESGVALIINGNVVGRYRGYLAYVSGTNGASDSGWLGHTFERGRTRLVAGWEYIDQADWVLKDWFVSDNSGRHVAYGVAKHGKWHNCVNGVIEQGFDRVAPVQFNEDGSHYAYKAKKGEAWCVVVDGAVLDNFTQVKEIRLASTSGAFGYLAERNQKEMLVHGRHTSKAYLECDALSLNADGVVAACRCRDASGWRVIVARGDDAEMEGEAFTNVSEPALSRNGLHSAYYASTDRSQYVIVDGKRTLEFRGSHGPAPLVSDDGRVTFFYGSDKSVHAVVKGVDAGLWDAVAMVTASPTKDSVAFVGARGAKHHVIRDGEVLVVHAEVKGLTFTPDGTDIAYAAKQDDGSWKVCVDRLCGPPHESVSANLFFSPGGEVLAYGFISPVRSVQYSVNGVLSGEYKGIGVPSFFDGTLSSYAWRASGDILLEYAVMGLPKPAR
jgi:hypothetical protein